jgi:uncharacterized peroxidase-related enzyme
LGFVPNLYAQLAEAPAALEAYTTLGRLVDKTSFDATERQVLLLAVSVENGCGYCVAAHSAIAKHLQGVDAATVDALRTQAPLADPRLDVLARFTREVVKSRGHPSAEALDEFLDAGFRPQQVLEVLLGVAMKTLSNYTNHITRTPVDEQFASETWEGASSG